MIVSVITLQFLTVYFLFAKKNRLRKWSVSAGDLSVPRVSVVGGASLQTHNENESKLWRMLWVRRVSLFVELQSYILYLGTRKHL